MSGRPTLVAAALLATGHGSAAQATEAILVTDVNVVDVAAGTVAEGQSELIEEGVIADVGADLEAATATAAPVDGGGAYVIPGLWDSHVHVFSRRPSPTRRCRSTC